MSSKTPSEIVECLDRHIIGQAAAKRAVAVAMRNRWRRMQLPPDMAGEITPRNIVMIGPTGVGKTEIARRLAQLVEAPLDLPARMAPRDRMAHRARTEPMGSPWSLLK